MFKLYGRIGSGSAAIEALLQLTGMAYELVDVATDADGKAPAWFLKVNPRGQVPALGLADGSPMTESAAIMIYLADLPECTWKGQRLAPASTEPMRASYLRFMVYLSAAAYDTALRYFYSDRFSTDPAHAGAIQARASEHLDADFDTLAAAAHPAGPFLLGANISAVDIYAAMLIGWAPDIDKLFKRLPRLQKLYRAVLTEPVIRSVFERHRFSLG